MDPYKIEGPAVISFSGGRTSAYMLRKILDAGLQPDVYVLFANTGKERPETLDFVRDVQVNWGVQIRWLEFRRDDDSPRSTFSEVDYETASRNGEPFERLIQIRKFLPNPVARFCTQELKVRLFKHWMMSMGYSHWFNVVGIRADEQRRVRRLLDPSKSAQWESLAPLNEAGVTKEMVLDFWSKQPFDLRLLPYQGNCDLCFLKARGIKIQVMKESPELAQWWIDMEQKTQGKFRADKHDYQRMLATSKQKTLLDSIAEKVDPVEETGIDCFCGD